MQSMSELMEHGPDLSDRKQCTIAGRWFREVGDIPDDRSRGQEAGLPFDRVSPCAATLARTSVVIKIHEPKSRAVGVEHLEDTHIGVIDGDVLPFPERDAVQLRRGIEDAVTQHAFHVEVLTHL